MTTEEDDSPESESESPPELGASEAHIGDVVATAEVVGGDDGEGELGDPTSKGELARVEEDGASGDEEDDDHGVGAAQLGATRYVMAGFFITGIAAAFVVGRVISSAWGQLAEARWAQKSLGFLALVGEEERAEYGTVLGAFVAIALAVYVYRRPDVRQWTDEVSSELAKVTWPDKNEVTNNTVVVIVTGTFATIYLALLDRFWGFVTNLVYGS